MPGKDRKLILASTSPRRQELLVQLGIDFDVIAVATEEMPRPGESPVAYVRRAAAQKSAHGQALAPPGSAILAADTEVVLDGEIFGKPESLDHARRMLRRLSGRTHEVLSAVSLRHGAWHREMLSVSRVTFREISPLEIEAYWHSGEPCDKAGGYAIQGKGALFVRHLSGSFSGVMGLPLYETGLLLGELGIEASVLLRGGGFGP
ncbi:MAG TPA: Maf family protein [Methylococcus sp.]|nr:Maf family protein [Methylococcus sp.]